MDISNFVTWFISQIGTMFTQCFSILQNITFLGTNLLSVILTILILTALLPIIFTIAPTNSLSKGYKYGVSERIRERKEK